MALTRLLIKDFRNIEAADLALAPGFNFLVGANGSGKTSVLEAVYTLGHGRAFRSLQAGRVIRHDQPEFVLHGRIEGAERELSHTTVLHACRKIEQLREESHDIKEDFSNLIRTLSS